MPIEIKKLIFKYWLIPICDEWCTDYISQNSFKIIDINKFKVITKGRRTIYGTYVCHKGSSYQWRIKINEYHGAGTLYWHPCIGIIINKKDILEKWVDDNGYAYKKQGYFVAGTTGKKIPETKKYCKTFDKIGDIMKVNLDLINYTLKYEINGKDYGIAFDNIEKYDYRLVVTVAEGENTELELM